MRARRKHSREFKVEAVRLVRERGVTMAQAARDLDLSVTLVRKWVRQFAADPTEAFPGQGQQKPADVELTQLRREVARLKMERDILKKAAVLYWRLTSVRGRTYSVTIINACSIHQTHGLPVKLYPRSEALPHFTRNLGEGR